MSECARIMKTDRLSYLIGKKVVIEKPGQQPIVGWLGLSSNGNNYTCWDAGSSIKFNDDNIDFVEINFVHLKV